MTALPLLVLALIAFTACGGDDDHSVAGATAENSATLPADAETRTYPPGTRTGNAPVDSFLKAVSGADIQGLQALLDYSSVPCSAAVADVFPACPAGAADGTLVHASYWNRCEGGWISRDIDLVPELQRYAATSLAVYAVAKLPSPARAVGQGGRPAGKYLVILDDERASSGEPRGAVLTETGHIGSMHTGCFSVTPQEFMSGVYSVYTVGGTPSDYLVAPP